MISPKIEKALNEQINAEMFSAYLYLAMVAYFQDKNLGGFANWMTVQNQEETFHAMKFFRYVSERGGRVTLDAIEKPQFEWESPLAAMEAAQKHEAYITSRINSLVDLAIKEKDHATASFLGWFVDEQVEEEDSVNEVVQKLRLLGSDGGGLFMMDRDMATRVFTPPVA
ncbi:ferritin [Desulfomicrobium baculatum]|uniref:Ferritin n=1 Tax=Desulfomicrobium baculatum (strain DSM 4028 / VKM B-1378 / X) TaxID=525897 RepID=C7LRN7_DESBD|nr:ferritin [Desulfomicrobium baculatum]ACU90545.1 Ferroxidase [Desulfomicrobium baculatum DSM 4028]